MNHPFAGPYDHLPLVPPFLALAMRPLPLLPLEFVIAGFLRRVCRRNPQILDRLGVHAGKRFGIKPTDLPFAFVIETVPPFPRLAVTRKLPADLDGRISSSLANLMALVEGRVDGDALMFSRQLAIEGDVEAVLALRNTIDDAQLNLVAEVASLFGVWEGPVSRILRGAQDSIIGSNPFPEETG